MRLASQRTAAYVGSVLAAALLGAGASGCVRMAELEGLACDDEHDCVEPYVCHAGACTLEPDDDDPTPLADGGHPCRGATCDGGGQGDDGGPSLDAGGDGGPPPVDGGRDGGDLVDAGHDASDPLDDGGPDDGGDAGDAGEPPFEGCIIDEVPYDPLGAHPTNACLRCDPAESITAWSMDCPDGEACDEGTCRAGCLVDGAFYAPDATPPVASCFVCDPASSTTSFTSACPAGQVCHEEQCQGGCLVDGLYYAPSETPADEECLQCQPATSTTTLTPVEADTPCDDGDLCTGSGVCDGDGVCADAPPVDCSSEDEACGRGVCNPDNGNCVVEPLPRGTSCAGGQVCDGDLGCVDGCFIGGTLYDDGEASANPCSGCLSDVSTTSFSPFAAGTSCGSGLVCDGAGTCEAGCFIGGTLYDDNATNPSNVCQVCDSAVSTGGWQNKPDDTPCPNEGNACTVDRCQAGACKHIAQPGQSCGSGGVCNAGGTCDLPKTLNVTVNGSGTVSGTGISCPGDCSHAYAHGAQVTLTASANANHTFTGWSGACSGPTSTCAVTMTQARSVTATFQPVSRTLTVNKSGAGTGTVTSDPAGISCGGDCTNGYAHGTVVTLTASPATGSDFSGWSGGCSGTSSTCNVTMNAAKTVTAIFALETRRLSVSRSGTGAGSVSSNPSGINCGASCQHDFSYGQSVSLFPSPSATSAFTGWSGACDGTGGCTVSMTAARSVTAEFTLVSQTLSVGTNGTGTGTVTSNPSGISCPGDCSQSYVQSTVVTLTAAPTSGTSAFGGWSLASCSDASTTCEVTMDQARSVTATFDIIPRTLTVSKSGTGTVTSNPTGISCGGDCSESYGHGTDVTLTATAGTGYDFDHWSGGCSGTSSSCVVDMTANKSVTAHFVEEPPATVTLTVDVSRNNTQQGSVSSSPAGISGCTPNAGTCQATFNNGQVVRLTATPTDFQFFSGNCVYVNATQCDVTMNANKTVTAQFEKVE